MVKDAISPTGQKFVICNVSEGEPGVNKDKYILNRWPETVIEGIQLAMNAVGAQQGYIYLRKDYYDELKIKLLQLLVASPLTSCVNRAAI